jgi:hypothetical protein
VFAAIQEWIGDDCSREMRWSFCAKIQYIATFKKEMLCTTPSIIRSDVSCVVHFHWFTFSPIRNRLGLLRVTGSENAYVSVRVPLS